MDENGNVSYTSGRVNTQNKHDFKYGKFEARIKVPSGKGFLPAFWMMPTDESYYGQWPKCGEIDIMEVMGQSTDTLHGTIHFGEPHTQKQGTHQLTEEDFAETHEISDDDLDAVTGGSDVSCACAMGGGGTKDTNDKTCACVLAGVGYDKWGGERCLCGFAGYGYDT